MHSFTTGRNRLLTCVGAGLTGLLILAVTQVASADSDHGPHHSSTFQVSTVLSGAALHHSFVSGTSTTPTSEKLSKPDDVTKLGDSLFTGFQNGVGPKASRAPAAISTAPL